MVLQEMDNLCVVSTAFMPNNILIVGTLKHDPFGFPLQTVIAE